MAVELRPLGVKCNLACHYCYQNPQRDAGNHGRGYDLDAMKAAILAEGGPFVLFGGEPLLLRKDDLEHMLAWGQERFGGSTIQTNGALVDDDHLRLFARYDVEVGISIDGPDELNDARWAGTLERTRSATRHAEGVIAALCARGRPPSLIVTLHRTNAAPNRLPRLAWWLRELDAAGVDRVRLHLLEVDGPGIRESLALSIEENTAAMLALWRLEPLLGRMRFDVFADLEALLGAQDDAATCVWRACDPYTTEAVRGVEGTGEASNCGRTNKDGIDFHKADHAGFERQIALYHTPQADGGCGGCRFFLACKGQCPGTAIDGDWRNRTEHCDVWKGLFAQTERRLLDRGAFPISVQPNRQYLEQVMLDAWAAGQNPTLREAIAWMYAQAAHG